MYDYNQGRDDNWDNDDHQYNGYQAPARRYTRRDRSNDPHTTIYMIRGDHKGMCPLHCMHCGRVMVEVKGEVDHILVDIPVSTDDYDNASTIRCKMCKKNYRLVDPNNYILK